MSKDDFFSFDEMPAMMSIAQVAAALNISKGGAYELAHQKNFPSILIGSRIVVPKNLLIDWLNAKLAHKGFTV